MDKIKKTTMTVAANGHKIINTESWWEAKAIGLRLRFKYGFKRKGETIRTFDEAIYPSFVKDQNEILTGWDHWLGYHFLSQDMATDDLLENLFREIS